MISPSAVRQAVPQQGEHMPVELFYVVLLLAVAVIFGYFYLKRAQSRTSRAGKPSETHDEGTSGPGDTPA